jgi:4-hydroxy-4-methyl-2-oxoglutarate aldolase
MIHVRTKIDRTPPDRIDKLRRFSAATLHEASGRIGAVSPRIKPIDPSMSLCGPAFTVRCGPRDNLMLHVAINYASPGDVIVVSAGEYEDAGSFGELLATACLARGIGGLVTDTGVRDTIELRKLGFPVFSLGVSIVGTTKEHLGAVNEPIVIGGVLITPGDVVRGDADGVVVVTRDAAEDTIRGAEIRVAAEHEAIVAYKAGQNVLEVGMLARIVAEKGLVTDE